MLVTASEKGDWQTITEQSKMLNDAKSEIEKLFEELTELTETVEIRSKEFEKRLSETGAGF